MSEAIKPNATSAFYNTLVPSLDDNANIQQALRMYHYGTTDGSIPDDSANPISTESVAYYLGSLQSQINAFSIGSEYSASAPSTPTNGYVWMDSASSSSMLLGTVAAYQNSEPTSGLVDGMLWVDKDSSPLTMYVYDAGTQAWRAIGS